MSAKVTPQDVDHIANLANIPVSEEEKVSLADAFSKTMDVVNQLNSANVEGVKPTHQVTNLTNVWREDVVIAEDMFTQEEALQNAKRTHKGFFVIPQVLEEK